MTEKLALDSESRKTLKQAQDAYFKAFHKNISSSNLMDAFYDTAVEMSGVVKLIEKSPPGSVTVVDLCGGRGRIGDAIKKLTQKEFNYVVVDISREELGKDSFKMRVIGDSVYQPLSGNSADAVFLLNLPLPLSVIKDHISAMKTKEYSFEEMEKGEALDSVGFAIDDIEELNKLLAADLLKQGGVMVIGMPSRGHAEKDAKALVGRIPIAFEEFREVKLDDRVQELWTNYGVDINSPVFCLASYRRKEGDVRNMIWFYSSQLEEDLSSLRNTSSFKRALSELEMKKDDKIGSESGKSG